MFKFIISVEYNISDGIYYLKFFNDQDVCVKCFVYKKIDSLYKDLTAAIHKDMWNYCEGHNDEDRIELINKQRDLLRDYYIENDLLICRGDTIFLIPGLFPEKDMVFWTTKLLMTTHPMIQRSSFSI